MEWRILSTLTMNLLKLKPTCMRLMGIDHLCLILLMNYSHFLFSIGHWNANKVIMQLK